MEGDLEQHPFPAVLQFIHERKATGRLVLRRDQVTKVVFMVEGAPQNVDSTVRDETLGRHLVKKGKISEQDFEKSIQLMVDKNIQQGAALVKLGCLSPRELFHEVKTQTREKLLTCFAWIRAEFSFHPGVEFIEDTYRFDMHVPALMREGIYRFFPPGAVEQQLARVGTGPILPLPGMTDKIGEYDLDEKDSALVIMIDGTRTLLEIKKQEPSHDKADKLLYMLLVCGLIGTHGKPEQAVRSIWEGELEFPPVEDFIRPSAQAPEVFEEDMVEQEEHSEEAPEAPAQAPVEEEQEPAKEEGETPGIEFFPSSSDGEMEVTWEGEGEEGEGGREEQEAGPREDVLEEEITVGAEDKQPGPDDIIAHFQSASQQPAEEEEGKEETRVLSMYMSVKSSDFFSLLGLSRDAGDEEIERAYRRLHAEWDKEKVSSELSPEAREKLEEINARIIRAYETLRTAELREQYREQLKKREEEERERPELQAEQYLQKGMQAVRKRDWKTARRMFDQAVKKKPGEAEYMGYLGWAIYSDTDEEPEKRTADAKDILKQAMSINPNLESLHVFMAKILKEQGEPEAAEKEFKTALELNPGCGEAERELKAREEGKW